MPWTYRLSDFSAPLQASKYPQNIFSFTEIEYTRTQKKLMIFSFKSFRKLFCWFSRDRKKMCVLFMCRNLLCSIDAECGFSEHLTFGNSKHLKWFQWKLDVYWIFERSRHDRYIQAPLSMYHCANYVILTMRRHYCWLYIFPFGPGTISCQCIGLCVCDNRIQFFFNLRSVVSIAFRFGILSQRVNLLERKMFICALCVWLQYSVCTNIISHWMK